MTDDTKGFSDLKALFINTTLTRSPAPSHTQLLIDVSADIMTKQGVTVDQFRAVDHQIATGVYPDMRDPGLGRRRVAGAVPPGPGRGHPGDRRPDLVGRQQQ